MKIFLLLLFMPFISFAQKTNTTQIKAIALKEFLDKRHYQPVKWDDSASVMLYNRWIGLMDDEKILLTASEISQLSQYRYKLDDELLGKDWKFLSYSTTLLQSGLKRADSMIRLILLKPIDITKPGSFTWPYKEYAVNEKELNTRWQKYLTWKILSDVCEEVYLKDSALPAIPPAGYNKLEEEERQKRKKAEAEYIASVANEYAANNVEDKYLNCIAWCYDPHSSYMNFSQKKEWDAETSASEYSAGFSLEENEKGDIAISYLEPGGSAWRSGQLHTGDILLKIKAKGREKEVKDLSDEEMEKLLNGTNISDIEITIRTAAGEIKSVKLAREKISDDESIVKSYVLRSGKNIGYINLPGFYSRNEDEEGAHRPEFNGCANDVSKEILKLKKDTIAGLILDLRFNGGGSMWEAMQLAGIFIDVGTVASVKEREGKVHFLKDPNRGTIYDGPMIVLINGTSASASEFVSAALQDYNRALIVGGATYGKGTSQILLPLDSLRPKSMQQEFVKVTTAKFYRVNGNTTQWKGVEPDIQLPDLYEGMYRESENESALKPDNSKPGIYQPLPNIPIAALKTKSEQRVSANPFFKDIIALHKDLIKVKTERTVSLQWADYVKQFMAVMDKYKNIKGEDEKLIPVSNNSFDKQKIKLSSDMTKETNEVYIKNIAGDGVISEACNIFKDWLK